MPGYLVLKLFSKLMSYKRGVVALMLASFLVLLGIHLNTSRSPSSSTALNVVHSHSFRQLNETFHCITTRIIGLKFPICIYTAVADKWVSGNLVAGGYFEGDVVGQLMRVLQRDRRLQFVDIGANIGLFSLPASRLTQVQLSSPTSIRWLDLPRPSTSERSVPTSPLYTTPSPKSALSPEWVLIAQTRVMRF